MPPGWLLGDVARSSLGLTTKDLASESCRIGRPSVLSAADVDGYELMLRQLLETGFSVSTAVTVRIRFEEVNDAMICAIDSVSASGEPVFARAPQV